MQKLIIAGNVGKDAVLRRTQSGEPVLGFSLAVDNGKDKDGNERPATWFDCNVWGKRGESLERHITKGTRLTLCGRPTTRAHDGKAYLGIAVDDLTFMGGSSDRAPQQGQQSSYDQQDDDGYQAGRVGGSQALDDDIPFMPEWR